MEDLRIRWTLSHASPLVGKMAAYETNILIGLAAPEALFITFISFWPIKKQLAFSETRKHTYSLPFVFYSNPNQTVCTLDDNMLTLIYCHQLTILLKI